MLWFFSIFRELERRIQQSEVEEHNILLTTATTGQGLSELKQRLYQKLFSSGFLAHHSFLLESYASDEYTFLKQYSTILSETLDLNDSLTVRCILSEVHLHKFASHFPHHPKSAPLTERNKWWLCLCLCKFCSERLKMSCYWSATNFYQELQKENWRKIRYLNNRTQTKSSLFIFIKNR